MNIVVLAGGVSTERDVSLVSGSEVYKALKQKGENAILLDVFLGYEGSVDRIFEKDIDWSEKITKVSESMPDIKALKATRKQKDNVLFGPQVLDICKMADIVFMALHGDCGENGKIQATFDLLDIKYTGTDSLSSALAMDKDITKQIFVYHGIPTPAAKLFRSKETAMDYKNNGLEIPCVVKVNDGGSSVGVYLVFDEKAYDDAIKEAFLLGNKILVEQFIKGREFTDCVMDGKALPIVEIAPISGFYDYKNKYQAGSTIETCPAEISEELTRKIQEIAVAAYEALGIHTYARMDFMVDDKENVYCLEANTLPGMTPTSLIPQEAKAIGMDFPDLCQRIIELSLKKYE